MSVETYHESFNALTERSTFSRCRPHICEVEEIKLHSRSIFLVFQQPPVPFTPSCRHSKLCETCSFRLHFPTRRISNFKFQILNFKLGASNVESRVASCLERGTLRIRYVDLILKFRSMRNRALKTLNGKNGRRTEFGTSRSLALSNILALLSLTFLNVSRTMYSLRLKHQRRQKSS